MSPNIISRLSILLRLSLIAVLLDLAHPALALAETADAFQFFAEEAKVVTASRRLESAEQAPVMVDVVTAKDIKASGATTLWDLLRFRVGLDVYEDRSVDGNRAVVSIRGFGREIVGDLLVLVDGQPIYSNAVAGTYWEQIPVQMQDIERIEIVRGPNAAMYGSNAGLGVINILTRKPQDKSSVSAGVSAGNLGHLRTEAAVEQSGERMAYRASYMRQATDGFDQASGGPGNDFILSNKGNLRTSWKLSGGRSLELAAGGVWHTEGIAPLPQATSKASASTQRIKFTQELQEGNGVDVMAARRDSLMVNYVAYDGQKDTTRDYQYDLEAVHHFGWWNSRMQTVWGANARRTVTDSVQFFGPGDAASIDNNLIRGFVNNSWKMTPWLSFSGALSIEQSEVFGSQPAYQFALIAVPVEHQTFRLSQAMAPTLPSLFARRADYPAAPNFRFIGNPDLKAEKLETTEVSYEGGWFARHLLLGANLYYMRMLNQRLYVATFDAFGGTARYVNSDPAIARGAEASLRYVWDAGRSVYANYTFTSISDALGSSDNEQGTPSHAFNTGGICALGPFTLSSNVGYKDTYLANTLTLGPAAIPAYWRVDARLGYSPWKDTELFIAGQNLATLRHVESGDGLAVPRAYQGGVSVKFGN